MAVTQDRLFSPRFFLMCGFSFTVFLSAFQLFPTAPFSAQFSTTHASVDGKMRLT